MHTRQVLLEYTLLYVYVSVPKLCQVLKNKHMALPYYRPVCGVVSPVCCSVFNTCSLVLFSGVLFSASEAPGILWQESSGTSCEIQCQYPVTRCATCCYA